MTNEDMIVSIGRIDRALSTLERQLSSEHLTAGTYRDPAETERLRRALNAAVQDIDALLGAEMTNHG